MSQSVVMYGDSNVTQSAVMCGDREVAWHSGRVFIFHARGPGF